ncbi:MAG: I78 family peptidase inhibitor [Sphingobium sp.]|jgi:hypothetical protein
MMRFGLIGCALLAGCATVPAETAAGGGECRNDGLATYVGRTVSAELGAELLKTSGARTLRWGPPDSAMTMDFRVDRLTVSYDRDSKIISVSCG